MNTIFNISGINIDNLNYEDVLSGINKIISERRQSYIVTVNPEMVLHASKDDKFWKILNNAEMRTADGIGILWAVDYLNKPKKNTLFGRYIQLLCSLSRILFFPKKIRRILEERITGSDLMPKIIDFAQYRGWRIFFLGAEEGIAQIAIQNLSKIYPKALFVGSFAGSPDENNDEIITEYINKTNPDIIFVAYGSPKQEFWIARNLNKLNSVKVAIGVGGAFDFYAGKIKRAPKFMQKFGLEWLWRLILQPKRIIRIWNATFGFTRFIFKQKNRLQ